MLGSNQRYEIGNVMFFPFIIKSITPTVNYMRRETVFIPSFTTAVSYKQQMISLRQKTNPTARVRNSSKTRVNMSPQTFLRLQIIEYKTFINIKI